MTETEFDDLFYAVRDAQILWKKRRQHAQGKINLHVDGDGSDWQVDECNEKIRHYEKLEKWLCDQFEPAEVG